jgi:putative transposase
MTPRVEQAKTGWGDCCVYGPKPRKRLLGRIKRMQRRISRRRHRNKEVGQKASRRQHIRQLRLSRLRVAKDAANKLTADMIDGLRRSSSMNLNVSGMAKNHSLAGAVPDCGWHEVRRQLEYKAAMRGLVESREELQVADGVAANATLSRNVIETPRSPEEACADMCPHASYFPNRSAAYGAGSQ